MSEILNINNKVENNGANDRGRLTATEFNRVVNNINDHTRQLAGLTLQPVKGGEDAFFQMGDYDPNTLYLVFEEE